MWEFVNLWLTVTAKNDELWLEARADGGISVAPKLFVYDEPADITEILERFFRPYDDVSAEELQRVGSHLFATLINPFYEIYRGARAAAYGKYFRLWLNIRDEQLAQLPWELLFDPDQSTFIALQANAVIIRVVDSTISIPTTPPTTSPLVVQLYASPDDLEALDVEASAALVQTAWQNRATLRPFPQTQRETFHRLPLNTSILYFDGHAGVDDTKGGYIALSDIAGLEDRFYFDQIANELSALTLRLLVLMGCNTATAPATSHKNLAHFLAQTLPLPNIVATRNLISERQAQTFNRVFSRALADGKPVEIAFTEGRRSIQTRQSTAGEWSIPTLFVRGNGGETFIPLSDIPPRQRVFFYPKTTAAIGHRDTIRTLLSRVDYLSQEPKGEMRLLVGRRGIGRSAVLESVLETSTASGVVSVGVRFESDGNITWLAPVPEDDYNQWREQVVARYPQALAQLGEGWIALITQCAAALETLDIHPAPPFGDDGRTLLAYLRAVARQTSVVLAIDEFQYAPSAWIELLRYIAADTEFRTTLPLLVLLTLESRQPLPRIWNEKSQNPYTQLLCKLQNEGLLHAHWLSTVALQDIREFLGVAEELLARQLHNLSGGVPSLVELIWEQWLAKNSVERDEKGVWYAIDENNLQVFGEAQDQVNLWLEQLEAYGSPYTKDKVQEMLTYAALEGETFTAQVIADLVKEDPDDLMDFWDSMLVEGVVEEGITPLLSDTGFIEYRYHGESRYLNRYRFIDNYWRYAFLYTLAPRDRSEKEHFLLRSLLSAYQAAPDHVSQRIIELANGLEVYDVLALYRQRLEDYETVAALQWQLDVLKVSPPTTRFEQIRQCELAFDLADKLYDSGKYELALPPAQLALTLSRGLKDTFREAQSCSIIGRVRRSLGELENARQHLERALEIAERILPPDHPYIATVLINLGRVRRDLGDFGAAQQLLERALVIREEVLPHYHSEIATVLNNLGYLLRDLGKFEAAQQYFERALEISERVLPLDHPDIATAHNNLGAVLQNLEEFEAARQHLEKALVIRERTMPSDHPEIAITLNNFGRVLGDLGKLEIAHQHLERALEIAERVLPPYHSEIATILMNLGHVRRNLGELDAAYQHLDRAVAILERVLPPDHPEIAFALTRFGSVLKSLGEFEIARQHCERALVILERVLPPDHPEIAFTLINLGDILKSLDKLETAQKYFDRADEIKKQSSPSP